MSKEHWIPAVLHRLPVPHADKAAIVLAAVEIYFDWSTWIQLDVALLYGLPLVVAAASGKRRLIWILALVLLIATFVVYVAQIPPGLFSLREPFFVNRILSAVALLLTAGLLHGLTLAVDALDSRSRALRVQNDQLDAANRQLILYREEITQKNKELERRRQEAEDASGRKTRVLASVSHDLRTPLTTIGLIADLIRQTANTPALANEVSGLTQTLEANARSLADVLSNLIDISYFDSGRIALQETEFDLKAMLLHECRSFEPLARAKGLSITLQHPESPVWVHADPVRLARVVRNLVSNAIKFTTVGGVTVSVEGHAGGGVVIRVADTGVGISADKIDRIFDEFEQLHDHDDQRTGWGLGLPICRRLVTAMGGSITVESEPSRGSTFRLLLPAARGSG